VVSTSQKVDRYESFDCPIFALLSLHNIQLHISLVDSFCPLPLAYPSQEEWQLPRRFSISPYDLISCERLQTFQHKTVGTDRLPIEILNQINVS
jgi:hypothetical protein